MSEEPKFGEVTCAPPYNPEEKCPECGHEEKYHDIDDDGWVSCSADNWSCNCGNNIGR